MTATPLPAPGGGPVQWTQPRTETSSSLVTIVVVILALVIILPLVAIVALIFLGGQVSQILSNVGNSI